MERHDHRRDRVRQALAKPDLGAILVSSTANVFYLTGFSGDSSVLIVGRDRDLIVSDGRFATQLQQECPGLEVDIRPNSEALGQAIARVIGGLAIGRLGFEAASLCVADHLQLQDALKSTELTPTNETIESLRQIKDESEVEAIREAVAIAETAFHRLRPELTPEATEKEVADKLEWLLRQAGATGSSFPPIVAVGTRSALPHARPTQDTKIGQADFVLVDWGATGRPYKSDLTRVVVTGKVTPKFESVYRTVLEAQERGIAAIRPGVRAQDVDAEARSVIEQAGFGRFFDHGLGHGIGIEIHEAPRLRKVSETVLEPGMVVTVEPGIYLPDWGGIRIEDDVLVTPEGREVLSRLPKMLEWAGG